MELKTCGKKPSRMSSMLGPGFRFHPTDEELVQYYLRRKSSGKACRFDAITDVDVYKTEPWDLPYMSKLKTRDLEWYFFSFLDKKYGNGARTNRATEKGYWKTTGKDRPVYHRRQIVGMKKTLVYHCGRAPKGQRSNWVMHEYRLAGSESETAAQDAFVLCRIFQKSGSGPKNGEQYGAPFVEEEWDDNELELVPEYDARQEVDFGDGACLESYDLQKILGSDVPLNLSPVISQSTDGSHDDEAKSFGGIQNLLASAVDGNNEPKMCYDQSIQNLPASYDMDAIPVTDEGVVAASRKSGSLESADDLSFPLNEPFLDSFANFPNVDDGFIEANDLLNPVETDAGVFEMLEEYLDAGDDSSLYFASDPTMTFGNEDLASNQTLLPQNMGKGTEQAIIPGGQLIDNNNFNAALSPDNLGPTEYQSDFQYPFIKQASRMLGNVHAPPAYAAEFPTKYAIRRLNSIARSPSSVHVTASTVQIRKPNNGGKGTDQENFNVVLSFGFSHGKDGSSSLESSVRIVPGKTASSISRGWLCLIFFCVLIFSMSFRIGNYIAI